MYSSSDRKHFNSLTSFFSLYRQTQKADLPQSFFWDDYVSACRSPLTPVRIEIFFTSDPYATILWDERVYSCGSYDDIL
jgi:hypothetical protein